MDNDKTIFTLSCDKDGYTRLEMTGDYSEGVPAKLYDLLCKAQLEAINWRCKNLKK